MRRARAFRQIAPIFSGFALLFASLAFLLAPVYFEAFSRAKLLGEIYVEEHMAIIEADGKAMAIDLNSELDSLESSDADRLIGAQAALRSLPVALVVRDDGEVVFDSSPYMDVSSEEVQRYLAHAEGEDQAVLVHSEDDAVVSVTKLDVRGADYLIVGRWIDERAVRDWRRAQNYIAVVGSNAGIWTTIVAVGVAILAVLAVWGATRQISRKGEPRRGRRREP